MKDNFTDTVITSDSRLKLAMSKLALTTKFELDETLDHLCKELFNKHYINSEDDSTEFKLAALPTLATIVCKTLIDQAVMISLSILGVDLTNDLLKRALSDTVPRMKKQFEREDKDNVEPEVSIH